MLIHSFINLIHSFIIYIHLYIYLFKMPICGGSLGGKSCRKMTQMCKSDPDFYFENLTLESSVEGLMIINKTVFDEEGVRFTTPEDFPNILQVGDFNLDGYPDLFLPVIDNATGNISIQLWVNTQCKDSRCPDIPPEKQKTQRTFERQTDGTEELMNIEGAYASAFFDFGETVNNYHLIIK